MGKPDWEFLLRFRIKPFLYKMVLLVGFVCLLFFLIANAWNFVIISAIQMYYTKCILDIEYPYGL